MHQRREVDSQLYLSQGVCVEVSFLGLFQGFFQGVF